MALHGDALAKAAREYRGFFIWCQENLLIKKLVTFVLLKGRAQHLNYFPLFSAFGGFASPSIPTSAKQAYHYCYIVSHSHWARMYFGVSCRKHFMTPTGASDSQQLSELP